MTGPEPPGALYPPPKKAKSTALSVLLLAVGAVVGAAGAWWVVAERTPEPGAVVTVIRLDDDNYQITVDGDIYESDNCICPDIEITEEDAVATARAEINFEPERTAARMLRQGFPTRPVWVVVFTVTDPEGGRDNFLRHAAVRVDARTGEVLNVEVSEPGNG